ncbi:HAD-IIIC family phosphatase [Candidatus Pelagibacter sp.]|nr:HAD-IIIC family phosphatase [Candidatus Pelagibacter sp.]
MKKKISFTSSSYLFDDPNIWGKLKDNFKLIFNDYRLYDQVSSDTSDYDVVILSFKDLINYPISDISKKNENKVCNEISKIFSTLKKKIKTYNKPLILFIDFFYGKENIKASQNFPLEEKIITFIKKKIENLFKYQNFFFFNIENLSARDNFFDNRLFYVSRCRFTYSCLIRISKVVYLTIKRIQNVSKKVLVVDCDNTLWGGVIGEDGYDGIKIGTDGEGLVYSDFQKSILRLKNEGVVLCAVSKNNLADVKEVFKKNKNMLLKFNDFSSVKANWDLKTNNIKELAIELNLSLESFVFFDDNPMERDQIRKNIPEVSVIEPDQDISNWPQQMFGFFEFVKFKLTKEDLLKTSQYKNRLKFVNEKKSGNKNELDFLKKINLSANIIKLNKSNEQRCLQIIHKTNQFNLTTKRYSTDQIHEYKKNKKNKIFLIDLKDKYGYHGLISLMMLRLEDDFIYIDNFAMSCRVLGRHLETWAISKIAEYAKKKNFKYIIGEYNKSKKNSIVKDLYKNLGFQYLQNKKNLPINLIKYFNTKSNLYIAETSKIDFPLTEVYLKNKTKI